MINVGKKYLAFGCRRFQIAPTNSPSVQVVQRSAREVLCVWFVVFELSREASPELALALALALLGHSYCCGLRLLC